VHWHLPSRAGRPEFPAQRQRAGIRDVAAPYYIVSDGEIGQQAFAVILEVIRKEGMVALGNVVFTSREHMIALEARGKGLMGRRNAFWLTH